MRHSPRSKTSTKRATATPEDVIAAATRLFRIKGYHAATIEEIAKRVGVRKGSLYHHIRSKEDILKTILVRTLDRLIVMAREVYASDLSPQEKLRKIIVRELQLAAEHPDDLAVYLGEKATLPKRLAQIVNERVDIYDRIGEKIIFDGIEAGLWNPREPKIVLLAIMGMLNWWPYWFNPHGRLSVEETAELLADCAEVVLRYMGPEFEEKAREKIVADNPSPGITPPPSRPSPAGSP